MSGTGICANDVVPGAQVEIADDNIIIDGSKENVYDGIDIRVITVENGYIMEAFDKSYVATSTSSLLDHIKKVLRENTTDSNFVGDKKE